jgi:hypothetical protein
MARRQRDKPRALAIEESIVSDEERSNSALDEGCEGSLKVAFVAVQQGTPRQELQ